MPLQLDRYQVQGVKRMLSQNLILGDEVGLGKTVQAAVAGRAAKPTSMLVVAKVSFLRDFKNELDKWWPDNEFQIWRGKGPMPHFCITNYHNLKGDCPQFDIVVIDEAHAFTNRKAKRTLLIRHITRRARRVWLLTANSMRNKVSEVWSLLHILYPKSFTSYWRFVQQWATVTVGDYGWEVSPGAKSPRLFAEFLDNYQLRRTQKQVRLQLPAVRDQVIWLDATPAQRRTIDDLRENMVTEIDGGLLVAGSVLERDVRGRQAAVSPRLFGSDELGCKVPALVDLCRQTADKVLVFSQWVRALELVAAALNDAEVGFQMYHGGLSQKARDTVIDRWRQSVAPRVLLLTLGAGGESLTLTESATVVILDEHWDPTVNEQAIGRVNRRGQTRMVNVFRLRTYDSMDTVVGEVLDFKVDVVSAVTRYLKGHDDDRSRAA